MDFRYFICLLGILLAIPLLGLAAMAFTLPVSFSGVLYLLCAGLSIAGFIVAPMLPKLYPLITITGLLGLMSIAGVRIVRAAPDTDASIQMLALPKGIKPSWVNALIDEQDALIFGETLFHLIGGDSANEHKGLTSAFSRTYSEMRAQGMYPSPVIRTYLNLQQPDHFDAVIIEPEQKTPDSFGVVFLHGYMGNVTAQCWEIAQAVKPIGGVTICPSTEWTGQWWQPEGQTIIQCTIEYLRTQGIERFYVGGFSNGGFSIGRLAAQWKETPGLKGLIFIDGFMDGASIREIGLPVLILEGAQDERVPVQAARQFAAEVGDIGTYVELEGDHFLIIKQPEEVQRAVAKWLEEQESRK
jgi:pimeloyl-ACP methyl ester carboxylesterase